MTCHPRVVKARGVAPDARGVVSLRVVGFRVHCDCGYLGERREGFFQARYEQQKHRREGALV